MMTHSQPHLKKKAVLLLSGGLDSVTVLEIAKSQGFEVHALSFRYGQRHAVELEAVQRVLKRSPVAEHRIVDLDLSLFGGSALTSSQLSVPKHEGDAPSTSTEIPVTYVPARNTIFLSIALAYAETIGSYDLFLGVNAIDYSNYPDCRPEFVQCFEQLANLATAAGVSGFRKFTVHAPLLRMTKAEIIRQGLALGVDYGLTNSCYDPSPEGRACGRCDACHLRRQGFEANGLKDPALE
jgi:7-cyano-7-deazaguanine synthase